MALGGTIRTYFDGTWHDGDVAVMRAADHGAWLGTSVFDGARQFDGVSPDLRAHCERVNRSAIAMMLSPTVSVDEMIEITNEGLRGFAPGAAVYIRPMYWAVDGNASTIMPEPSSTAFCISLEEIAMPAPEAAVTLGKTRFRRPVLETAVVNAKAGCLYPNNARMFAEARARGFGNALVLDALGNVAETASSNVFMVRDGAVFTPIPNGTFLAGITRARVIELLRADGITVTETVLGYADFETADEVFATGNMSKVTPVTAFEDRRYEVGAITARARNLYWDWAHSG